MVLPLSAIRQEVKKGTCPGVKWGLVSSGPVVAPAMVVYFLTSRMNLNVNKR